MYVEKKHGRSRSKRDRYSPRIGGDGETDETTPLYPSHRDEGARGEDLNRHDRERERERKQGARRKGESIPLPEWQQRGHEFPSIPGMDTTKTNTSRSQETSYIDTPSGGLLFVSRREQEKQEVEGRIKDEYQNPNFKKFFSYKDDFDRIVLKLLRKDAKEYHFDNPSEFPKTLQEALGKTRVEYNQEAYETKLKEDQKQKERKKICRCKEGRSQKF